MRTRNDTRRLGQALDIQVLVIYLILVVWGWLTIYSASYDFDNASLFSLDLSSGKQFIWMLISAGVGIVLLNIDSRWYYDAADLVYALVMLLLMVTIVVAPDTKGSRSWLYLGPITLQPAEFAKFATALAVAKFVGRDDREGRQRRLYLAVGVFLLPVALIVLQKETGSALVYFALFIALYREGMSSWPLLGGLGAVVYFIIAVRFGDMSLLGTTNLGYFVGLMLAALVMVLMFWTANRGENRQCIVLLVLNLLPLLPAAAVCHWWKPFSLVYVQLAGLTASMVYLVVASFRKEYRRLWSSLLFMLFSAAFLLLADVAFDKALRPHQQMRTKVFLGMVDDPTNAGYNVNQAKISIGSGGFLGKGYLNGTQTKLKYVPEQHTDFIFCTVAEELGFVGSALLVLLYMYLMFRLVLMAERQRNPFVRIYGYCVVSIFFFHVLVNIGMVLGVMPVIGIPLPFFSYGGSSLLSFTVLLFIFLRMDADRFLYN